MANITLTEASGVADSVFGKVQAPIKMFVESMFDNTAATAACKAIFKEVRSEHALESYGGMTGMQGWKPVGENGAVPHDTMRETYRQVLPNETWKDSFSVSAEMVEDSTLINFREQPAAFINGYWDTREEFCAAMLGGAIGGKSEITFEGRTFNTLAADGKGLFAKDHPSILNGSKQSNLYAGAFSAANLGKLETVMHQFKGDNDKLVRVSPDTIIIPDIADLKNEVFGVIGADKDPATSNNAFNYQYGRWTVITWAYLNQFVASDTKPWILLDSKFNDMFGTLIFQNRLDMALRSYIDENTQANCWSGRARYTAGFNNWRGVAVGGVTGGSTL